MFGSLTYKPHSLYLKSQRKRFDASGNFEGVTESLVYICGCRCDDVSVRDGISVNGEVFFPSYHVVSEKPVKCGDFVKILANDGSVRAEGKVVRVSHANYFNLYQLWM